MTSPQGTNRFLDALPAATARRCLQLGTPTEFGAGVVVAHRDANVMVVHFTLSGAISEIEEGLDGDSVEVTAIGFEGVSPIEALLDVDTEQFLRVAHVPTRSIVVPLAELRALQAQDPALHRLVHRYAAARLRAAGITIGCNARHEAPARLARWLLRLHDRAGDGDFEITHETISLMLGVRRATVTRAIAALSASGAIVSRRGSVRVARRAVLLSACCSCYPEARDVYNSVYDRDARSTEL